MGRLPSVFTFFFFFQKFLVFATLALICVVVAILVKSSQGYWDAKAVAHRPPARRDRRSIAHGTDHRSEKSLSLP